MAKKDLLDNPDFQEYQEDLRKLLQKRIVDMHHFLSLHTKTWEEAQVKVMKIEALMAVVAEIEGIIGFPITYMKQEQKPPAAKIEREQKKNSNLFIEIFQKVFTKSLRKES